MLYSCHLKQCFHAKTWRDISVHYFCIKLNEKHGSHSEKNVKTNLSNFMADWSGHAGERTLNFGLFAIVSTLVHVWELSPVYFTCLAQLYLYYMRICCIHVLIFQKTLPGNLRSRQVFEAQPGPFLFEKSIRFSGLSLLDSD